MTDAEFRAFLEDISTCFLERDCDLWAARILRPFTMITRSGPVYCRTPEDLRANFDLYIEAMTIMKVTDVLRRPISLEPSEDGTWIGTYETELLSRGQRATAPYTSSALLHEVDGTWRMSSILGARGHHDWTGPKPVAWET